MIRPIACGILLALAAPAPAHATTVAPPPQFVDLTTPPPPAGTHSTPSILVITQQYVKRWDVKPKNCVTCHVTFDKKGRQLTATGGGVYGRPAEIPLPATALLFGTALAGVAYTVKRKRTR